MSFDFVDQNANSKKLKSVAPSDSFRNQFFTNTSEWIAKEITKKIVSLSISNAVVGKIYNTIPEFCYDKLKNNLNKFVQMSFISYDRDDRTDIEYLPYNWSRVEPGEHPRSAAPKRNKTEAASKKTNENDNQILPNLSIIEMNKQNLTTLNDINNSISDYFEKEKVNFDVIDKVETHSHMSDNKINLKTAPLFFDDVYLGKNSWDYWTQPKPVDIDRDASTTIKFDKVTEDNSLRIHANEPEKAPEEKKSQVFYGHHTTKKKHFSPFAKKKFKAPPEFPYFPIPEEDLVDYVEPENASELRVEKQQENVKKMQEQKRRMQEKMEQLAIEREKLQKKKDLESKNITVDIDGNIINIRPLDSEALPKEFYKISSETKTLQEIEGEGAAINPKPVKVEKNPGPQVDKRAIKINSPISNVVGMVKDWKKKKNNQKSIIPVVQNNNMFQIKPDNDREFRPQKVYDKTNIPAGSPFNALQCEVGVSCLEDSMYKTGGKDFYKKYQKYSVENFQTEQTTTNKVKKKDKSNDKITEIKEESKDKAELSNTFVNMEPNSTNNTWNVKTKNLKNALNKLDLITEEEEREYQLFNRTKPMNWFNKTKSNFNEANTEDMDKFAKTLVGTKAWGTKDLKFNPKVQMRRIPKKPEGKELGWEMPK